MTGPAKPVRVESRRARRADDARVRRTLSRLGRVVLDLAAEGDISSATVSEVARRAGINRNTFYDHARSPVELLTRILSDELTSIRNRYLEQVWIRPQDFMQFTRDGLREFVDHVLKHEHIYGNRTSSSYEALRVVLGHHLEESMMQVLHHGVFTMPKGGERAFPLRAAQFGHGIAAAIEVWLQQPKPREIEFLLDAVEDSVPHWLADIA